MSSNGRLLLGLLYVLGNLALIIGLALKVRRERLSWRVLPLALYLLLQTAWTLMLVTSGLRWLSGSELGGIAGYVALGASLALLCTTLVFIQAGPLAWLWLLLPATSAGAALALDARLFGSRGIATTVNGWVITQEGLRLATGTLAWGLASGLAIWLAGRARTSLSSPLHRNRLRYWIFALAPMTLGTGLALSRALALPDVFWLVGGAATLLGSLLMVVTWRVYYLPSLRLMLRGTVSYAVITLVTFAIYLLGIRIAQWAFGMQTQWGPILGTVLVAAVLAVGYTPLRQGVQRLTERAFGGAAVDYAASLQEYSQRTTQVLELEPLAAMVVDTVNAALGVSRGALFLAQDEANFGLTLQAIGGTSIAASEKLECPADSPITQHWRRNGGALLQFDVDVQPAFRQVSSAERATLKSWRMEMYLPIRVMGQIIGVLALGSKTSRDPYLESDMAYVAALADQTGVALQNARLFSDLHVMNKQLADLNLDLEHANEQLQDLDRLKSAFIGVITHELRSPFAALDFSMQLIQKYGLEHLLPDQRDQLDQLAGGLKRAETMINNLITFAAFLSKQGQLRMAPLDLGRLAQEMVQTLEPMALKRNISMTVEIADGLPLVDGDRERLSDAIHHLVHNAVRFNRDGGSVRLTCHPAPEHVVIEISDTGVGIPQEQLPQMWEDFTQMADPLRRGAEGLGLGLPLVKYVVKAHNGQVWARSHVGEGSTFGFSIPIRSAFHEPTPLVERHRDGRLGALVSRQQ
jgi:signal transduction histidine kinase